MSTTISATGELSQLLQQMIQAYQKYKEAPKHSGMKGVERALEFGQSSKFCSLACQIAWGGKNKGDPQKHVKYMECYWTCKHLVGRVELPLAESLQEFINYLQQSGAPEAQKVINAIQQALSGAGGGA